MLLISVSAAPQPDQSHNLSEIRPIDIDLNMSEQDIFNVSQFQLDNGFILEGNAVRNQGNSQDIIRLKDSGNVGVPNGDIKLSSGNALILKDQNQFVRHRASDDYIRIGGYTGTQIYGTNSDQVIGSFSDNGTVFIPSGDLKLNYNSLKQVGYLQGGGTLAIDSTGGIDNGKIVLGDSTSGQKGLVVEGDGEVNIPNGDLDLAGNRIANVSAPESGGDAVNRTYVQNYADNNDNKGTDDQNLQASSRSGSTVTIPIEGGSSTSFSDNTVPDDQTLSEVLSSGNSAGSNSLDINGNELKSLGAINHSGTGVDMVWQGGDNDIEFQHYRNPGTDYLRFDYDNNKLVMPDANLDLRSNQAQFKNGADVATISMDGSSNFILEGRDPDQRLELTNGGDLVYKEYFGSNPVFRVQSEASNDTNVSLEGATQLDTNGNNVNLDGGNLTSSSEICAGDQC